MVAIFIGVVYVALLMILIKEKKDRIINEELKNRGYSMIIIWEYTLKHIKFSE